jgi:hypothetical protein
MAEEDNGKQPDGLSRRSECQRRALADHARTTTRCVRSSGPRTRRSARRGSGRVTRNRQRSRFTARRQHGVREHIRRRSTPVSELNHPTDHDVPRLTPVIRSLLSWRPPAHIACLPDSCAARCDDRISLNPRAVTTFCGHRWRARQNFGENGRFGGRRSICLTEFKWPTYDASAPADQLG